MPKKCSRTCPLRTQTEVQQADEPIHLLTHGSEVQSAIAKELYRPIKEWQTRVLVLKDGPLNSPLVADLVTVDLIWAPGVVIHDSQEKIQYIALSYTWGPPNFSQRLGVNGMQYPITENLYLYLQRCRQRVHTPALWVDAVCINQHNNDEKSSQVANMLHIYRKAVSAEVWLGEAGPYCHFAMDYLDWATKAEFSSRHEIKHTAECRYKAVSAIEGMMDLYRRPWLERVWIRQEVWAANRLEVISGSRTISWRTFARMPDDILQDLTECFRKEFDLPKNFIRAQGLKNLTKGLSRRRKGELVEPQKDRPVAPEVGEHRHDIVRVLNKSIHAQATDERDRVYGILGMTNTRTTTAAEAQGLELVVNYSKSLGDVFGDVAKYVMKRDSSAAALLCLNGQFASPGLPSWCPDWRAKTSWRPYLEYEDRIRSSSYFHADSDDESATGEARVDRLDAVQMLTWTSAMDKQSAVLTLTGTKFATLTKDCDPHVIRDIRLRSKSEPHRSGQIFRQHGSNERRALANYLGGVSQETKEQYQRQLDSDRPIEIEVKVRQHTERFTLRSGDVKCKHSKLLVVPLSPLDNRAPLEDDEDEVEESRWRDLKPMHAMPIGDVAVPHSRTTRSPLLRSYYEADNKAKARSARREVKQVAESQTENKGKSSTLQQLPTNAGTDSDSGSTGSMSVDSWRTDGTEDTMPRRSDCDSDDRSDKSEIIFSSMAVGLGASDDSDWNSLNSIRRFDSDDSTDSDNLTSQTWDKRHAHRYFPVTTLNKLYNDHFPTEFAVSKKAEPGDVVVMLQGSALPLVLRPIPGGQYTYVSPALLTYRSIYLPSELPEAPKDVKHLLKRCHRPQESVYEHLQLLLDMKLEKGTTEAFVIV